MAASPWPVPGEGAVRDEGPLEDVRGASEARCSMVVFGPLPRFCCDAEHVDQL